MMKIMSKLISWLFLFMSYTVSADDTIPIYSLNTTEGAELECFENNVKLSFAGETYQGNIVVYNELNMLKVMSNIDYYNVPYYIDDPESQTVFTVSKTYFIKNKEIVSAISLDPFYKNDAKDDVFIMKNALEEAHEKNKCLSWSFDDIK